MNPNVDPTLRFSVREDVMARLLKNNGLTIVLMLLFLVSLTGQLLTGWHVANEEASRHGRAMTSFVAYSVGPEFLSTLFENWESEFLQMAAYVVLTAFLMQRGSAESKDLGEPPRDDPACAARGAVG
jgi:hypothetical protein